MRIYHHSDINQLIPLIAREIINIEYGKLVYDGLQRLPYPWKNYLTIKYNDVEFNADIRKGFIGIPNSFKDKFNPDKIKLIITLLLEELEDIDHQLQDFPRHLIPVSNDEYTPSGITFYVEDNNFIGNRRNIKDNLYGRQPNTPGNYLYTWNLYWHDELIIFLDTNANGKRPQLSILLRSLSMIIWDPTHIFKFKDMELREDFPNISNLSCYDKLTMTCFQFHPIYGIKWHIYKLHHIKLINHICHELNYKVYRESFDNINLVKFKVNSSENLTQIESTLKKFDLVLCLDKSKRLSKSADKKDDSKEDFRNDLCCICETMLYDDIYVLEVMKPIGKLFNRELDPSLKFAIHFGLCDICVGDIDIPKIIKILSRYQWTMLKVTFPRTFKEVLQLLKYPIKDIEIMTYIYDLQTSNHQYLKYDGMISGPKIATFSNISDLLKYSDKNYNYLFRYKMIWY